MIQLQREAGTCSISVFLLFSFVWVEFVVFFFLRAVLRNTILESGRRRNFFSEGI